MKAPSLHETLVASYHESNMISCRRYTRELRMNHVRADRNTYRRVTASAVLKSSTILLSKRARLISNLKNNGIHIPRVTHTLIDANRSKPPSMPSGIGRVPGGDVGATTAVGEVAAMPTH